MPQKTPEFNMAYLIGLTSSLVGLALILLTLYMIPVLLLGLKYSIPAFLITLREYFVSQLNIGDTGAALFVILLFAMLGFVFGYIGYRFDNQVEKQEIFEQTGEEVEFKTPGEEKEHVETDVDRVVPPASPFFVEKIMGLVVLIVAVLFFIHWLIST